MTPSASEYGLAVLLSIANAKEDLELGEYRQLLSFLADVVARKICQTWKYDPDRPEGWL